MAIVKRFDVNKEQVTLDADIIENMSANDVSYDASTQYDENTVGNKFSELNQQLLNIEGRVPQDLLCDEYIQVTVDSDGRILESLDTDGLRRFVKGFGVKDVVDYTSIECPEYLKILTDSDGRIIYSISANGEVFTNNPLIKRLDVRVKEQENLLKATSDEVTELSNRVDKIDSSHTYLVTKSGRDLYIRMPLNATEDLVVHMANSRGNDNWTFVETFLGTKNETLSQIKNKRVHVWTDSTAPLFNTIYAPWHMFVQHGYQIPVAKASHTLTADDLNSTWVDNAGREFTIGKITSSQLYLLPKVTATDIPGVYTRSWKCPSNEPTAISLLTHVRGAVHTQPISVSSISSYQIKPIQKSVGLRILADSMDITDKEGDFGCSSLSITETLECTNPFTVTQWFDSNGNDAPIRTSIACIIKQSFYWHGLACRYDTTLEALEPLMFEHYGANQAQHLVPIDTLPGYKVFVAIPRARDIDIPFESSKTSSSKIVKRDLVSLYDINKLTNCQYSYFLNEETLDRKFGFASGISLIKGITTDAERLKYAPEGTLIQTLSPTNNNKMYIRPLRAEIWENNVMPTSFVANFSTFYTYYDTKLNDGDVWWYKDGSNWVVYIHTHEAYEKKTIFLDKEMEGCHAEIIDKTDGVELLTDGVVDGSIYIKADAARNNYIILKLN